MPPPGSNPAGRVRAPVQNAPGSFDCACGRVLPPTQPQRYLLNSPEVDQQVAVCFFFVGFFTTSNKRYDMYCMVFKLYVRHGHNRYVRHGPNGNFLPQHVTKRLYFLLLKRNLNAPNRTDPKCETGGSVLLLRGVLHHSRRAPPPRTGQIPHEVNWSNPPHNKLVHLSAKQTTT